MQSFLILCIAAIPISLSVANVVQLFSKRKKRIVVITELLGIIIGAIYLIFALSMENVTFEMWNTEIFDIYHYPPFDPSRMYQIVIAAAAGFFGWLFLRICPLEKQPPLAAVLAFSAVYFAFAELVLYMIQIWGCETWFFVVVYPINIFLIIVKLIREQAVYRSEQPIKEELNGIKKILSFSCALPVLGFLFLALLIGLVMIVLILFGQTPDEMIKLWTNTAEWTFSKQTPPPKVPYDGHYLCTVAANGHQKLVKPLRTGKRSGHLILVNRQLMIANAFEDLIKERTPGFHRAIRNFYDATGFPVSKYITTRLRSDVVYILMKPLEWIFLMTLYLFDPNPEKRIAVQYMQ